MKLELKHLAPYLPYGLRLVWPIGIYNGVRLNEAHVLILDGLKAGGYVSSSPIQGFHHAENFGIKPILRPLSDLTKEIEHNGESFVPFEKLFGSALIDIGYKPLINTINGGFELAAACSGYRTDYSSYTQYQKLFEWHFDVFGLIDAKLAIDINTVEI